MGVFRLGHERQLQPAHPALDGVLPLRILHVEQVREHVHPDRAPVAVCQPALERRPRLLQHCRIRFSVILQVIYQAPQLPDLLFEITALFIVRLEHLIDIFARILYALPETFAQLRLDLSPAEVLDPVEHGIAHIVCDHGGFRPHPQPSCGLAPLLAVRRVHLLECHKLLELAFLHPQIARLQIRQNLDQLLLDVLQVRVKLCPVRLKTRQLLRSRPDPILVRGDLVLQFQDFRAPYHGAGANDVGADRKPPFPRLLHFAQQFYPMAHILDLFLNVAVGAELFAELSDDIPLVFRKHVILDELPCAVCHPERDGTLLHHRKASAVDIPQQDVVERIGVRLLGGIDAVDIPSPVFGAGGALLHKLPDLLVGVRISLRREIS